MHREVGMYESGPEQQQENFSEQSGTDCRMYKDRAAPPIGGPALHDSDVKTVQWRKRECHDSYQEVEVYLVHNIYYIYVCSLCDKY